jgi:hypothetical protein
MPERSRRRASGGQDARSERPATGLGRPDPRRAWPKSSAAGRCISSDANRRARLAGTLALHRRSPSTDARPPQTLALHRRSPSTDARPPRESRVTPGGSAHAPGAGVRRRAEAGCRSEVGVERAEGRMPGASVRRRDWADPTLAGHGRSRAQQDVAKVATPIVTRGGWGQPPSRGQERACPSVRPSRSLPGCRAGSAAASTAAACPGRRWRRATRTGR